MLSVKPRSRSQSPSDRRARDAELVRAASAGGEEARRRLAERVLDRIRTSVRYLCGDSAESADLVQQCLVEVLRSVRGFRGESRLETWVDRVTIRTAMRRLQSRRAELARELPEDPVAATSLDDPERALTRARVQARLAAMMQKLNPERRGALVLQVVYGYSISEIADMTQAPKETVRDRLKVGKRRLRRLVLTDDALREWAKDLKP